MRLNTTVVWHLDAGGGSRPHHQVREVVVLFELLGFWGAAFLTISFVILMSLSFSNGFNVSIGILVFLFVAWLASLVGGWFNFFVILAMVIGALIYYRWHQDTKLRKEVGEDEFQKILEQRKCQRQRWLSETPQA